MVIDLLQLVAADSGVTGSVVGRGFRLSPVWGRFPGMSLTIAGAPCAPTPSSFKACNATTIRSGCCFTQLQLPIVKVAVAPSMVINVILVVPTPSRPVIGGLCELSSDGGDQAVRDPVPLGLAVPAAPPRTRHHGAIFYCSPLPPSRGTASRRPSRMLVTCFPRKTTSLKVAWGVNRQSNLKLI
jgi:hypothetical protein